MVVQLLDIQDIRDSLDIQVILLFQVTLLTLDNPDIQVILGETVYQVTLDI